MVENKNNYPVDLNIDYPEKFERLTAFFRIFTVIPILIILGLLVKGTYESNFGPFLKYVYQSAGFVVVPTVLMILFRKKYPKWWFDWNLALIKFATRVFSYLILLTDEYPSTDEDQAVHIEIPYPEVKNKLRRGMPLIKWFLAIPHVFIIFLFYIAVVFITIISWFSILFTGKYPKGLFKFVVGVIRWSIRVIAYAVILTTDKYPPFKLNK